nr:hypothetical protein [Ameyamaea chiangmaiensis]
MILAAGAVAVGRPVVLFGAGVGVRALARDWSTLDGAADDAAYQARGVAGFATLREAARDLGCVFLACESGLRVAILADDDLMPGVAVAGVPSFLSATKGWQIATF